ncbi:type I restriction-modification enzyme R subunit C-terminal domain-containing protein [Aeromonas caviae]|nr:type I restriction-modification enzyme R subunit C-terminal domain-containing protein [Aeromonas caviae]MDX7709448.1 type I restriction-modification enzyme R subunit C-terminal domain-containing protein [Aeromonas caviae]
MQPLVKNPDITLAQLAGELSDERSLEQALSVAGDEPGQSQADTILNQLSQKLMRVLRKAESKADRYPALKQKLAELGEEWGIEPGKLHQHLHQLGPRQASHFLRQHATLLRELAQVEELIGSEYRPVISDHQDRLTLREQSYGAYGRPQDYLDGFADFIRQQVNGNAALMAVINAPRNLTRAQLKEVKLLLDSAGFKEANLQSAWRNQTNQDIAASIIGHIRRAALGEPLIPYSERVRLAMEQIYRSQSWTPVQRKWLDRLARQLVHEVIVDRDFINERFADDGGAKRLDGLLGRQLDKLLDQLGDALWQVA